MTLTEQTHARPVKHFTERQQPKSALHSMQQPDTELKARMDGAAFRMLASERGSLLFGLE
ncbi:hypothetical protein MF271_02125 (plasmid) [Deinococcus sp. KNUC1210]|uniref:hypothetical protein n=1 Tax=Deinococcus sp. KNUC1210 TaxID=2917691 RepID=UPI001EF15D82|nr:hypothetical protein [Deinococcus sp. KNUC1210]ULH14099.1 hypothetical protein MF271_02125 [Deinococcus sp. KNUC1210]